MWSKLILCEKFSQYRGEQSCRDCHGATENAGVEKSGGKCRNRLVVWKTEPILYSDTAVTYLKLTS